MILLPHFTRAVVLRSVLTWLVLRAAAAGGTVATAGSLGLQTPHALLLSPRVVILLLTVATAVGWIYAHRYNEDRFLLSLGYTRARLIATMLLPLIVLECGILIAVLH
jgi:hypothetical protein